MGAFNKSRWKKSKRTHWVLLFIDRNKVVSLASFGTKYIAQEVLTKSKINQSFTIYLAYKLMILLCVNVIASLS